MILDPLAIDEDRNARSVFVVGLIFILFNYSKLFNRLLCIYAFCFAQISDECFVKPCSSKATSVIRLASQKSPKPSSSASLLSATASSIAAPAPIPSIPSTPPTSINIVRPAGNRQSVKKLVVKLKKPFVPVIEEEANLHPPGE